MARKKAEEKQKKLQVKLVKSPIGYTVRTKETVKSLGLRRMHQVAIHNDSPMIRGMIAKVAHLVEVEEVEA